MTCSKKTITEKSLRIAKFGGMALATLALTFLAGATFSTAGGAGINILREKQESRYELRGVVQSVDKSKKRATIKHEKIPNLMDAMTMPFLIKDEKALNEMEPGDQIRATLVMTNDGGQWLEKITIIAKGARKQTSSSGPETPRLGRPLTLRFAVDRGL